MHRRTVRDLPPIRNTVRDTVSSPDRPNWDGVMMSPRIACGASIPKIPIIPTPAFQGYSGGGVYSTVISDETPERRFKYPSSSPSRCCACKIAFPRADSMLTRSRCRWVPGQSDKQRGAARPVDARRLRVTHEERHKVFEAPLFSSEHVNILELTTVP